MAREYGLFSDEGCIEGGFHDPQEAYAAIESRYSEEDGLKVLEICPYHPDEAAEWCEPCQQDDEEE